MDPIDRIERTMFIDNCPRKDVPYEIVEEYRVVLFIDDFL